MAAELRWHPQAVADLQRAVDWYHSQNDGAILVGRFENTGRVDSGPAQADT